MASDLRDKLKRVILTKLPIGLLQNLKKIYHAHHLANQTDSDEIEFNIIKSLVGLGDIVVDVGSNIGVYTRFFSKLVGDRGRVYSIEPVPQTFEILAYCVEKLGLNNVELLEYAASDTDENLLMEIPLWDWGGENFYQAKVVETPREKHLRYVKVKSRKLDTLFLGLESNISFIKCDVEGHELKCVKGTTGVISDSHPAWLVELSGQPDDFQSSAYELVRLLNNEGYDIYWFDGTYLKRRNLGDRNNNFFFLTAKHLNILCQKGLLHLTT